MSSPRVHNPTLRIGEIGLTCLTDAAPPFPGPPSQMFPTVSEAEWEEFHDAYPGAFDGVDTWIAHISCTLVRTPEQLILVDTGLGPSTTAFAQFLESGGELPQRLAEEGVAPSDIDVVFLTHLHSDHVGWNTEPESDDPFFPNARYIAPEADWEFCQWRVKHEPERAAYIHENVIPLHERGKLELVDGGFSLGDAITTVHTPGHTPGLQSLKIEPTDSRTVWLIGDVAAHPLQITNTSHEYSFDVDPRAATETRSELIDRIETQDAIVSAPHFPMPSWGQIVRRDGKRHWQPV